MIVLLTIDAVVDERGEVIAWWRPSAHTQSLRPWRMKFRRILKHSQNRQILNEEDTFMSNESPEPDENAQTPQMMDARCSLFAVR